MRTVRLLAAAAAVAGSFALSAPAEAQPCIPYNSVAWFCVLPEYWYRGVAGGVFGVDYFLAGEGCYYPNGQPHYYVHAATGTTGTIVEYTIPVNAPACV